MEHDNLRSRQTTGFLLGGTHVYPQHSSKQLQAVVENDREKTALKCIQCDPARNISKVTYLLRYVPENPSRLHAKQRFQGFSIGAHYSCRLLESNSKKGSQKMAILTTREKGPDRPFHLFQSASQKIVTTSVHHAWPHIHSIIHWPIMPVDPCNPLSGRGGGGGGRGTAGCQDVICTRLYIKLASISPPGSILVLSQECFLTGILVNPC